MARFDVFANPVSSERKHTPYFLDVQNDFIDALNTRVVVPLRLQSMFGPCARNLNPGFEVLGRAVVLDAAALGAVPASELRKPVASLRTSRQAIHEALDTMFGAY